MSNETQLSANHVNEVLRVERGLRRICTKNIISEDDYAAIVRKLLIISGIVNERSSTQTSTVISPALAYLLKSILEALDAGALKNGEC